jgi:hypothetical protein
VSDSAAQVERRWRFDWDWAHGLGLGIAWEFSGVLVWLGPVWFEVEREETVPWP